jgi:hypothetical protein
MAYNEAALLPIWAKHYARQVGADHCYVIDHGSTQPLALPAGINVLRLPRSPHDDQRRAGFVGKFTASLLDYYDWVIHTDVDELVLADPLQYDNLPAFCAATRQSTVCAIGLDIQQVPALEPTLDPTRPIGAQRGWVRFTSAMCKPVLTRVPLVWAPGFHCADQQLGFGQLFLFHLHWADRALGIERLGKTRTMPWADLGFGGHQRISDPQWTTIFDGMAALPRAAPVPFDMAVPPLRTWLDRTMASGGGREGETYTIDLHLNAAELWPIPPHFRERL